MIESSLFRSKYNKLSKHIRCFIAALGSFNNVSFKKTGAPIGTPVFLLRDGNLFSLVKRFDGDGSLVGLGQDAVLAEDALAGAAYT